MRLAIIDYGMGNIKSLNGALKFIGVDEIVLTREYDVLQSADKLVLPGVGSFCKAMETIRQYKIDDYLQELVVKQQKPILGICLGMQLLCESSLEGGKNNGLGFIKGHVLKFKNGKVRVPHVGFNQVKINNKAKLYKGMKGELDFYFIHSYKLTSEFAIIPSQCDYEDGFIASFEQKNIAGVQYHPEISQHNGLNVLKNFVSEF
jgi:imidazole glycerol-phosphate synthase subunit HisH